MPAGRNYITLIVFLTVVFKLVCFGVSLICLVTYFPVAFVTELKVRYYILERHFATTYNKHLVLLNVKYCHNYISYHV